MSSASLYGTSVIRMIREIGYAIVSSHREYKVGEPLQGWEEDHIGQPIVVAGTPTDEEILMAAEAALRLGQVPHPLKGLLPFRYKVVTD